MIRIAFVVACLMLTGATAATPTSGQPRDVLPHVQPAPHTMEC